MKKQIINIVSSIINVPCAELSGESGPISLREWDSLAHVTIVAAIEQLYGITLTMAEILEVKSINDLETAINQHIMKQG